MKGLEISILRLSEAMEGNRDKRIDSQYFKRDALAADMLIMNRNPQTIKAIASDVRSFGAYALTNEFEYKDEGVPFLRGTNYSGNFIDFNDVLRISPEAHGLLHKSEVRPDMVLLSMSGSVGSVAVALESWPYPINSNQDIAKIVPSKISPFYLAAYLSSRFGRTQIDRLPVGSVQQHVFLWMIERIQVPRFGSGLEQRISEQVREAYTAYESVSARFENAENSLLRAMGLDGWTPPEPLTHEAKASEALAAGRLDAQYFRPLFAELEERLFNTGQAVELGTILVVNARGRQPLYIEDGLPVINSKHVRPNRVILADNRTATEAGSPVVIEKGDVLVNGTGVGTIGRVAPYLYDQRALPDNHVTVLRSEHVDPIYLAMFLNSFLGQWQIERHIKGSSGQIELYPKDIAKIMFWDAPDGVQASVRDAVMSAFAEGQRADELLKAANRAVEIAIEEGEPAAMAYLDTLEQIV